MSIESWCEEFYSVEASEMAGKSDIECLEHSLKKWKGLSQESLERHGLVVNRYLVGNAIAATDKRRYIYIDSSSCALCEKYLEPHLPCKGCPIHKNTGFDCSREYECFYHSLLPQKMITLLEDTLKWQKDKGDL